MQKSVKKVRNFTEIFTRPTPLFCWFAGLMLMGGSGGGFFAPSQRSLKNLYSNKLVVISIDKTYQVHKRVSTLLRT
jgi:hypothetical protein